MAVQLNPIALWEPAERGRFDRRRRQNGRTLALGSKKSVFRTDGTRRSIRHKMPESVQDDSEQSMLRLATLVQADTAADAIHPNSQAAKVALSDPLDLALQVMIRTDLVDIPIVDDDQRIVGDLLFSDVLRYLLRQHRDVC